MSNHAGRFVWYELMTKDAAAAVAFYHAVVGWSAQDVGQPGHPYTMLNVGDNAVGGIMQLDQAMCDAGARAGWIGYIAVDDVDAYAKRVTAGGGVVHRPPEDLPTVGRFAIVADPEGAGFVLFKPAATAKDTAAGTGPGTFGWHELFAKDAQRMFAFYSELFGWKKAEAVDMGPMGVYQLFSAATGNTMGGMMSTGAEGPRGWNYYSRVDDIHAGAGRVKSAGGKIVQEPHEVPGGGFITQCHDPEGVLFSLLAPR